MASIAEMSHESLSRAISGQSVMNYTAILEGFSERGIPLNDIRPRENVFTFWAWKALGRRVKKGEHGVKVTTFIAVSGQKDAASETGERRPGYRMPRSVTVFHISQTESAAEVL
ncbi:ArdC-like ssDNA-binding domain-containing protein [Silvimonas sp.]|uniref:ArdC-like ssDNA-binding domain-containing protein n=1 Tax=Silvimonas sp. TaxID=2650811 RepID=UPI002848FF60|nr:ArdC-like ssDNA-binding domain-containing protein [Silvimonas sp.]MDR3426103.1 ArdC-like ssDNA-binding domain-containing protein [Silvimonas sp.]